MTKFQIYQDRRGEYRWRLRARNGEIIADGNEGYSSKASCEHGIDLVKQQAANAEVEDQTERRANADRTENADTMEPTTMLTTTLEDEGEGSEGTSRLVLLKQRVLLEDLAQEELDKSGRFLRITPTEKGSGSTDVSMDHDRYLTED